MKKLMITVLALVLALSGMALCEAGGYRQISQDEAAQIMAEDTDWVLLDVRTPEEYDEGHIPGAINLPNEDIGDDAPQRLQDRAQTILVYCRSGRRSKEAAEKLAALGYTRVLEFGGILTWTGEIVSTEAEEILKNKDDFMENKEINAENTGKAKKKQEISENKDDDDGKGTAPAGEGASLGSGYVLVDEEDFEDDPYEAQTFDSPEDFYEEYFDEFYDYEEAEEYFYENGGW